MLLFFDFQTMNDSRALKKRVMQYLGPVTVVSILFNITKFFEITVEWRAINYETNITREVNDTLFNDSTNMTSDYITVNATRWSPYLNVTEFRTDPSYSINFNWFRFIAIGVIPFVLLVYFNTQIYYDIRKQRRKRHLRSRRAHASFAVTEVTEVANNVVNTNDTRLRMTVRRMLQKTKLGRSGSGENDGIKMDENTVVGKGSAEAGDANEASALIHQSDNNSKMTSARPAILTVRSQNQVSKTSLRG